MTNGSIRPTITLTLLIVSAAVRAGEIAGIPSQAPPFLQRDFELNFSNDFLGRGGATDDFRTQQINVTGRISEHWLVLADHSILTLGSADPPGRIDQASASLGYEWISTATDNMADKITVGGGLRSVGNFAGSRMQNGFHQLIGSDIATMEYVDSEQTDVTAWIDVETYRSFHQFDQGAALEGWRTGYWLRGSSLLTSSGQWDNAIGAYLISSKRNIDIWLGLRRDWRSGYDQDPVQQATAQAESKLAVVLGMRFGAVILETVQQPDGAASYGQLKFIATGKMPFPRSVEWPQYSVGVAFLLPDVQVALTGKTRRNWFTGPESLWTDSLLLGVTFGEPQYGDDTSLFVESRQVTVGMEWERQLSDKEDWISYYASGSAGYRSEQLRGEGLLSGEQSEQTGRPVLAAATGLRFNAAAPGMSWNFRLQLGIDAWFPIGSADVTILDSTYGIQKSALAISLGMTFDF